MAYGTFFSFASATCMRAFSISFEIGFSPRVGMRALRSSMVGTWWSPPFSLPAVAMLAASIWMPESSISFTL